MNTDKWLEEMRDERDSWKARAEAAEKDLHHAKVDGAIASDRAWERVTEWKARAEKAEAALGRSWYFEMVSAEADRDRLREMMVLADRLLGDDHGAESCDSGPCICGLDVWRARVRAERET